MTSDDDLFDQQMTDVRAFDAVDEIDPLPVEAVDRGPGLPRPDPRASLAGAPETEALRLFHRASGLEAAHPSLDLRVLRRLRRGTPPPEEQLDLHGMERARARRLLTEGVALAVSKGHRVLLLVHGRGLHSDEDGPVLKALVPEWLMAPPVAPHVLAFTPARPADGGEGALYVLLRRGR